jgi:hypothetical protein
MNDLSVCTYPLQLIFVLVETDNEDVGKPVSDYFGISGTAPKVIIYFSLCSI